MPLDSPWVETTLGEHVRLVSGGTPSKGNPDFWGGGTLWVTAKDMKSLWIERTDDKLTKKGAEQANWVAPAGTVLMLVRGMTLHHDVPIVRLKVPAAFNQDVKAIIPGPAIDPNYLFYLLRSHKPDLLEAVDAAGHGTGRLASDALNRMAISLPSLSEQRVIHEMLAAIDEKVELNSAMVSTLEHAARTLFQSWFVDCDPVHAKAEGRDPGLPADIAALFPDSFGDDGLPEGWAMDKVGALFDIVAGNTPSTFNEGFWGAPHAWATPKDMSSLRSPILDETSRQLTGAGLAAASSGLVPAGSLLLSSRAPIGYLAFAAMPLAINQGIAAFVKKEISTALLQIPERAERGPVSAPLMRCRR